MNYLIAFHKKSKIGSSVLPLSSMRGAGKVKFMNECLLNTEKQGRVYYDDIDEYEDLKDVIKRCIKEQIDYYSQFKLVCNHE